MDVLAISLNSDRTDYLHATLTDKAKVIKLSTTIPLLNYLQLEDETNITNVMKNICLPKRELPQIYLTLPTYMFRLGTWKYEKLIKKFDAVENQEINKFLDFQIKNECCNKNNFVINRNNRIVKKSENELLISSGAIDTKYISLIEKISKDNNFNICSIEPQALSLLRIIFAVTKSFILYEKYERCTVATVCNSQKGIFSIPFFDKYSKNINENIFFTEKIIEEIFKQKSKDIPIFIYNVYSSENAGYENKNQNQRFKKIRIPKFMRYEKHISVSEMEILHLIGTIEKGLIDNRSEYGYENRRFEDEFSLRKIMSKKLLYFKEKKNTEKYKKFFLDIWNRNNHRN